MGLVENIVGKGENAGHQHFLLFPQSSQKPFQGRYKLGLYGKELKEKALKRGLMHLRYAL